MPGQTRTTTFIVSTLLLTGPSVLADPIRHPARVRHDLEVRPIRRSHAATAVGASEEVGLEPARRGEHTGPSRGALLNSSQIKMILTTVEGENDPEYRENVLHSWLG